MPSMKNQSREERVHWLLADLCTRFGFCGAGYCRDRMEALVSEGLEAFTDQVLIAEGFDLKLQTGWHADLLKIVAERFDRWAEADAIPDE